MIRRILLLPPTKLKLISTLASVAFVCLLAAWVSTHGGFDERIEAGNQDVASDPSNSQPRLVRAELLQHHGDFAAALRDLDDASRLSPELRRIDDFRGLGNPPQRGTP